MLIFSLDRNLQLSAVLESFYLHCSDVPQLSVYTKNCGALKKNEFKNDVIWILSDWDYVLLCVDDTIFTNPFSLEEIIEYLDKYKNVIGFSLRLGLNTTYCYMTGRKHNMPEFTELNKNVLEFDWRKKRPDFGYPLEISSSVYRTTDILPIIETSEFDNPNKLEVILNENKNTLNKSKLLCYKKSVAFSAPFNKVQNVFPENKTMGYTTEQFEDFFKAGKRIDVKSYAGIETISAHQNISLNLKCH